MPPTRLGRLADVPALAPPVALAENRREALAEVEITVVPPLCPVDVSPYDFTRAGELIDRAARSTREWLDGGSFARRGIPHQLRIHAHNRIAA